MKRNVILAIFGGFLIFALFVPLFRLTETRQFQEDEHIFVRRGIFADYYLSGNFSDPIWQSFDSYDVPKFAELFYGVALRISSGKTVAAYLATIPHFLNPPSKTEFLWPIIYSREYCCSIQALPSEIQARMQPILIARKFGVFFGLGILAVCFALCWRVKNWPFAMIATLLIGQNILFSQSVTTAMGDGPLIFFSFLYALFAGLFFAHEKSGKPTAKKFLLLAGISTGLATATKLNGVINIFHFSLTSLLLLGWFQRPIKTLRTILEFVAVAYLVFIILNPYLWPNLLKNTLFMNITRQVTIERQQQNSHTSQQALYTIPERLSRTYSRTLSPTAPYGNFVSSIALPTGLVLFIVGLFFAYQEYMKDTKHGWLARVKRFCLFVLHPELQEKQTEQVSFVVWIALWLIVTTLLIPLDWDHYYLPIVISVSCVQAYAIVEGVRWLLTKFPPSLKIIPHQE